MVDFKTPINDQRSCSLLYKLPTEIRLRIWCKLLKREGSVRPCGKDTLYRRCHDHVSPSHCANFTSLAAQALVCCQQMHDELRNVLYNENAVLVRIGTAGHISVLGSVLHDDNRAFWECYRIYTCSEVPWPITSKLCGRD